MSYFRVKDIQPNPFRNLILNPIKQNKVEALIASMENTEYWENLVARIGPNGKPQLAYGHHRWKALEQSSKYGPNAKVKLIIKNLDDATMLKMMANENMEEWGTTLEVVQETIRAVVYAYAEGKIKLIRPSDKDGSQDLRYAPSFIRKTELNRAPGLASKEFPYNALTIAKFLGWATRSDGRAGDRVYTALAALEEIEKGELPEDTFTGLGLERAKAVITEKRRAERAGYDKDTARQVARHVADTFRKEGKNIGVSKATDIAEEVLPKQQTKNLPDINSFARTMCQRLDALFEGNEIRSLIKYSEYVDDKWRKALVSRLRKHGEKAIQYADELE